MNAGHRTRRARFVWTGIAAAACFVAAAQGMGCELVVGTDDFKTSSSKGGTGTETASQTGTATSTQTGGNTGRDGSTGNDGSTPHDSGSSSTSSGGPEMDGTAPASDGTAPASDGGAGPDATGEGGTPPADAGHDSGSGSEGGASEGGVPDSGSNVCTVSQADQSDSCNLCWKLDCCTTYSACIADTGCSGMLTCLQNCSVSSNEPCGCATPSTSSLQLYAALASCGEQNTTTDCENCQEQGTGDPCQTGDDFDCVGSVDGFCMVDPFCGATTCPSWCSPSACTVNSDCLGDYANGANQYGDSLICAPLFDGAGDTQCFPLCNPSDSNACANYPGSLCQGGVDNQNNPVNFCQ